MTLIHLFAKKYNLHGDYYDGKVKNHTCLINLLRKTDYTDYCLVMGSFHIVSSLTVNAGWLVNFSKLSNTFIFDV